MRLKGLKFRGLSIDEIEINGFQFYFLIVANGVLTFAIQNNTISIYVEENATEGTIEKVIEQINLSNSENRVKLDIERGEKTDIIPYDETQFASYKLSKKLHEYLKKSGDLTCSDLIKFMKSEYTGKNESSLRGINIYIEICSEGQLPLIVVDETASDYISDKITQNLDWKIRTLIVGDTAKRFLLKNRIKTIKNDIINTKDGIESMSSNRRKNSQQDDKHEIFVPIFGSAEDLSYSKADRSKHTIKIAIFPSEGGNTGVREDFSALKNLSTHLQCEYGAETLNEFFSGINPTAEEACCSHSTLTAAAKFLDSNWAIGMQSNLIYICYYLGHGNRNSELVFPYWGNECIPFMTKDGENTKKKSFVKRFIDKIKNDETNKNVHLIFVADSCYSGSLVEDLANLPKHDVDCLNSKSCSISVQSSASWWQEAIGGVFTPYYCQYVINGEQSITKPSLSLNPQYQYASNVTKGTLPECIKKKFLFEGLVSINFIISDTRGKPKIQKRGNDSEYEVLDIKLGHTINTGEVDLELFSHVKKKNHDNCNCTNRDEDPCEFISHIHCISSDNEIKCFVNEKYPFSKVAAGTHGILNKTVFCLLNFYPKKLARLHGFG